MRPLVILKFIVYLKIILVEFFANSCDCKNIKFNKGVELIPHQETRSKTLKSKPFGNRFLFYWYTT